MRTGCLRTWRRWCLPRDNRVILTKWNPRKVVPQCRTAQVCLHGCGLAAAAHAQTNRGICATSKPHILGTNLHQLSAPQHSQPLLLAPHRAVHSGEDLRGHKGYSPAIWCAVSHYALRCAVMKQAALTPLPGEARCDEQTVLVTRRQGH